MKKLDLISLAKYVILILVLSLIFSKLTPGPSKKDIKELERRHEIEKDSLKKLYDGRYTKLVRDIETEKSLKEELKEKNKELYDELEEARDKIISLTSIVISLEDQLDVINLPEEVKEGDTISFYYPNNINPFVTHTIRFSDLKTVHSKWEFKPIKLDMVVTETETGTYRVDMDTEEFIEISSFEFISLPMSPITDDRKLKFQWVYGAGVWKSPNNFGVDLYGGIKVNNMNLMLRVQPSDQSQIGLSILVNN